jgi:hypothetical protein
MCYVNEKQKFWNELKWKGEVIQMEKRKALKKAQREEEKRKAEEDMQRQVEVYGHVRTRRDSWP